MSTAIVLAAGESRRMQGMGDKVLLPLAGSPLVVHSLRVMQQEELVEQIVLVTAKRLFDELGNMAKQHGISKLVSIVSGGSTRQESVWNGMAALPASAELVVVHDAARPCLAAGDLRQVIVDGKRYGAAILAVPVKDTIKLVSGQRVLDTPDRSQLWAAQTPQVFARQLLVESHRSAREQGVEATDDASLVARLGHQVHVTQGDYSNIKVTTPEDIIFAEAYLERRRLADASWNRL